MDSPDQPPHSPPAADHATLWLNEDGDPTLCGMHVYPGNIERLNAEDPPYNQWFDLFEFAREWGLEVSILPKSWYARGRTVQWSSTHLSGSARRKTKRDGQVCSHLNLPLST
jgi:hypothetical protein